MSRRYKQILLCLCTFALFVTVFARLAISPVVQDIIKEFEVTNTLVGLALTFMWVSYAVSQYPSGVLADRFGDHLIILVSVGGTGLTSLMIAGAPNFLVFTIGTILLGGVAGLHYSVATALLSRTFDDIGTAIGIHNGGAPLAGVLSPVIITWTATEFGWRPAIALSSLFAVPVFIGIAVSARPTSPRRPSESLRENLNFEKILGLWQRPSIIFTGVIATFCDFTWQTIASFLPYFFVQYHNLQQETAALLFGIYFVALGILQIGVGYIADWYGNDIATGLCMTAGIGGIILIVSGSIFPMFLTGVVLLGLSMGFGSSVFPRFMNLVPAEEQSIDFGIFRTSYMIVAALGPVVIGFLSDWFDWGIAFGFLAFILAIGCLMLLWNHLFNMDL